ncbi:peptide chain release factor-like protein [Reyranella sp. CPCC 100927]|uniref:peptide chain release factor-like protein n=1 Tax=Reyranella sp. CPCC 100927 TaxID=2599616 RepID=UPI0011B41866|nr:peptide chain release factor-like protein [Reyranella sp. CPCC 100927]TWS99839.1 peptide chain release factor-like protein [Reyranella sp. CPCC 100927]
MDRAYTRREFYDLVWSQPMRTLAADFGISDVALAKHCKRMNIPVPERGYWARKQAGKPVSKVSLPPRFFGATDRIGYSRDASAYGSDWAEHFVKMVVPEPPEFDEDMDSVRYRATKLVGKVRYQKTFELAHPLVSRLLAHEEEEKHYALRWQLSSPRTKYETSIERRRLLLINTIFLAAARLDCRPSMSTSKYQDERDGRPLDIKIGDTNVPFTIEAVASRKEPQRTRLRLALGTAHSRAGFSQFWEDDDTTLLDHQLTTVLVEMLVAAEESHRQNLVRHREWLVERKADAEKELRERAEKAEREARLLAEKQARERVALLLAQARELERANRIRTYVSTVLSRASEIEAPSEALDEWAAWAREQADSLDPLLNGAVVKSVSRHRDLPA